jgi:hypothetical protein
MKTCHEKIKSVLSLGVLLKDETTPDKSVTGDVFLKAHGVKKQPVRHSTGYFLFVDLPEGRYQLTAGGKYYEQEDFLIDTESVKPGEPFVELILRKKGSHWK